MKKRILTAVLALLLAFQACLPVFAEETGTDPSEISADVTDTAEAETEETLAETDLAFGSVSILNGCRTIDSYMPLGGSDRQTSTTAQSMMIYERKTGTVIYSYNPDAKVAPGSLAKLVNAYVVIQNVKDLDSVVTCGQGIASRIPSGSLNVKLKSDEQLTVNDLLNCMILQSANDAAVALAEYVAGNQSAFVTLMNKCVQDMGCTNTEFSDVHGLNTTQYTTARDMARFINEAVKNETFKELFAAESYTVPETNMSEERTFQSTNYLIETTNVQKFKDSRVTGGMNSYVSAAVGASIVFTADNSTETKQGLEIVCAIMGSTREFYENGWMVKTYGNFEDAITMLEFVYNNYKVNRIIYDGQSLKQFPVSNGEAYIVGQSHIDVDSVLPNDCQFSNLVLNYTIRAQGLSAPIAKDEQIATVEVWYRNSCLTEVEVYAMEGIKSSDNSGLTIQHGGTKNDSDVSGFAKFVWIFSGVIISITVIYLIVNNALRRRGRARKRQQRRRSR